MILSNPQERRRFIRFSIVGISGTVIDFGIFNILIQLLNNHPVIAKIVSFSIAVFNNYLWNRLWTYPESRNHPFLKQITQFLIVSVIGLFINTLIFSLSYKPLINFAERFLANEFIPSSTVIGHNLAAIIATLVVLFWNYFANRYWTFRDVDKA